MGVEPAIGRAFRPEEDQVPGRDAVVVLGHAFWEQTFGSDPAVLGRTVRLNGTPFTVIGVAPAEFTGLDQFVRSDFFVPLMMSPRLIADPKTASLEARDARNLRIKGRLKPGVTQAQAQAELTRDRADLQRAYPDTNKNRDFVVRTELQARIGEDPPDATLSRCCRRSRSPCCSSRAATSPDCWPAARRSAPARWRCGSRSAPDADG